MAGQGHGGPGTVGYAQVEGFHTYARDMSQVRGTLTGITRTHHTVLRYPAIGTFPEADAGPELHLLTVANEQAITRLADYSTRADRGLSGLAYVAAYVGTHFPATDGASADQVSALVRKGRDGIPPVPAELPGVDPRFVSPAKA